MIQFRCSTCGAKYQVSDDKAGNLVHCPKCSAAVTIPRSSSPVADQTSQAPAVKMKDGTSEWFFMKDGKKHGPIEKDELLELAQRGLLVADDLIWNKALSSWTAAWEVGGFEFLGPFKVDAIELASSSSSEPQGKHYTAQPVSSEPPRIPYRMRQQPKSVKPKIPRQPSFIHTDVTAILLTILGGIFVAIAFWDVARIILKESAEFHSDNAIGMTANVIQALNLNILWIGQMLLAMLCFVLASLKRLRNEIVNSRYRE